ncbi:hypothetical protein [Brevibacillus marinus]|uniref:hypothetical protein n=1 Tax=Brevibacillus marinus TaxID=2496837 RepID=UPI000F822B02|nr:hypothetical protein [Brevibacillus marinus]
MNDRNYDQDLRDLIERWDPIMKKVQESHSEADSRGFWPAFCVAALAHIQNLFGILKGIPGMILGFACILTVIGAYFEWPLLIDVAQYLISENKIPYYVSIGLLVIVGFIGFVIWEMADPQHNHFHIAAYRWVKRSEYRAMTPFLGGSKKFTFEDLANRFTSYRDLNEKLVQAYEEIRRIEAELNTEKAEHQKTKDEFEHVAKQMIDEKNELLEAQGDQIEYLFLILKEVKTNIDRFINGTFSTSDLGFLAPYTLYKLQEDRLIKIDDVRTSSHGKKEIILSEHPDYATVRVLTHPEPYWITEFEPGRMMLTLRLDMLDGEVWVINFHIDQSDDRLMKLFFEDAIIDSTILFELIAAHCRLAQLASKSKRAKRSQSQGMNERRR